MKSESAITIIALGAGRNREVGSQDKGKGIHQRGH
jgi:hypothetical protein